MLIHSRYFSIWYPPNPHVSAYSLPMYNCLQRILSEVSWDQLAGADGLEMDKLIQVEEELANTSLLKLFLT